MVPGYGIVYLVREEMRLLFLNGMEPVYADDDAVKEFDGHVQQTVISRNSSARQHTTN